jgi:hypothetical protein
MSRVLGELTGDSLVRHVNGNASNGKTAEDKLASRFQKIDRRLAKQKRKRKHKHFSWEWQRWRDLATIFEKRDGWLIKESDICEELIWGKAQEVGNILSLTAKERTMWKITTIRACDQTAKQAAVTRKAKKRDREQARRKAAGATPRRLSLSQTKPWEDEGISRRTWERHRDANSCMTQFRANHLSSTCSPRTCDTSGAAMPGMVYFTGWPASSKSVRKTPARLRPDSWPALAALGYLMRLAEYRRLTSGKLVKAVPGLAACSELRRGVA